MTLAVAHVLANDAVHVRTLVRRELQPFGVRLRLGDFVQLDAMAEVTFGVFCALVSMLRCGQFGSADLIRRWRLMMREGTTVDATLIAGLRLTITESRPAS